MSKVVLISYLERNKKVTIPGESTVGDLEYLREEFLKNFNFDRNVKLQITFQQFDPEWNEYVDLEDDAVVCNKDKLKVVVTPCLSDSLPPSTNASVVSTEDGCLEGNGTELEVGLYLCVV